MAVRRAPTPRGSDLHVPARASSLRHSVVPDSPPSTTPPPASKPPTPRRVTAHGAILLPCAAPATTCAFCGGDTLHNKIRRPEDLVACYECGSAGHPTCLDWADPSVTYKRAKKYPWLCVDCKRCEVCDTKGDDDDMLLCDSCDRGWHQHCLNPPMLKVPKTKWSCPTCASGTFFSDALSSTVLAKRPHLPVVGPFSLSLALAPNPAAAQTPRKRDKGKQKALDQSAPAPAPSEMTSVDPGGGLKLTLRLGLASTDSGPALGDSSTPTGVTTPAAEFKRRGRPPKHPRPPMTKEEHEANRLRIRERAEQRERDRALKDAAESDPDEDPDDDDEEPEEPYGGILDLKDRVVGDRAPAEQDRKRWERARDEADTKALSEYSVAPSTPIARVTTDDSPIEPPSEAESALDAHSLATALLAHRPAPTSLAAIPPGNVRAIRFGEYEIGTWYQAPFPDEFSRVPEGRLWICEFCLKYMKGGFQAGRHRLKCKTRHPPGDEIYRDGKVSVFEVDGRKNKIYCQNLCLLAKMFLDHKTLYYDVEPFLFYVMTTADTTGAKFVGYFSKEKRSPTNNVSCIMTLPVRQRKGWGNLLIDFSYLLSKKEGRTGTPERPLSDLGLLSYRNYWTLIIFRYLAALPPDSCVTIEEISTTTALTPDDVFFILSAHSLILDLDLSAVAPAPVAPALPSPVSRSSGGGGGGNQWSSRKRTSQMASATLAGSSSSRPHESDAHSELVPPIPSAYRIAWDPDVVRAHVERYDGKGYLRLRPERLQWSPFLVTRYGVDPPPAEPPSEPDVEPNAEAGPSGEKRNGGDLAPPVGPTFDPSRHVNGTNGHVAVEVEEPESDDEGSVRVEEAEYVDESDDELDEDAQEDDDEDRPRKRRRFADGDLDAPASRLRLRHSRGSETSSRPLRSARSAEGGRERSEDDDEDAEGEDDDPDQSLGIVF